MADNKIDKKMELINELDEHYLGWTEDNDQRMTRKNGWNDITDAYWGKLPSNWPYQSKVIDPRIQTSLKEKNARLLNSKLRGDLTPRDGEGDSSRRNYRTLSLTTNGTTLITVVACYLNSQ